MSKLWKIIISIVLAVVVIGVVGAGGFIAGREWTLRALAQGPRPVAQVPGGLTNPNQNGGQNQGRNNLSPREAFRWFFRPGHREFLGRGFQPERGRPFGFSFVPFFLIGGLIRGLIALAFLALLISLAVFVYRGWQPRPLASTTAATPLDSTPGTDEAINEG